MADTISRTREQKREGEKGETMVSEEQRIVELDRLRATEYAAFVARANRRRKMEARAVEVQRELARRLARSAGSPAKTD